jgi:signal transduction histidine kinase
MRLKLFLAFFLVLLTALVSVIFFRRMMAEDFEHYAMGVREDRLYWVMASVEGARAPDGWDLHALEHAVQWGAILGFELEVLNESGIPIVTTIGVMNSVTPTMQRRIESFVSLEGTGGSAEFDEYPLFSMGTEVGMLLARPIPIRQGLLSKEAMFRERGSTFLLISFAVAGGAALVLAVGFSLYLTVPLNRLRLAAERVAGGDLDVRVKPGGDDDIGRLIDTFNHMVESLGREEALRAHLTSNIAHELRTPLAVLRANLEALADGVVTPNAPTFDGLQAEVARLTALVQGIEDFARAEASFLKPAEFQHVELGAFLEGLLHGFRTLFAEAGIRLDLETGAEAVECSTDPGKLETAVRNIVSNALAYTPAGGSVRVTYGRGSGGVYLKVADTGIGIAPERIETVFKRFHRGEGSTGFGLGLAIARELVNAMGGSIGVTSVHGQGAEFRITLPG